MAADQTTPRPGGAVGARSLLELDPELGQLLGEQRREAARHDLLVRVTRLPTGAWDGERLAETGPENVGLLLLEGVMAREVVVGDTVSTELLGTGDVVRPWQLQADARLVRVGVRWNALMPLSLAVLDRRVAAGLGRYPEVTAVLIDRLSERAQRLAVSQAISQLNRVEARLVALLWHLAERWGRVSADGVVVPLALSHRLLGQLVGARRPTVSTALGALAREGRVQRRRDGTWLLQGDPEGVPADVDPEVVPQRRRLMPVDPGERHEPTVAPAPPAPAMGELKASLDALRETWEERTRRLRELQDEAAGLREHSMVLRGRRLAQLRERERAVGS